MDITPERLNPNRIEQIKRVHVMADPDESSSFAVRHRHRGELLGHVAWLDQWNARLAEERDAASRKVDRQMTEQCEKLTAERDAALAEVRNWEQETHSTRAELAVARMERADELSSMTAAFTQSQTDYERARQEAREQREGRLRAEAVVAEQDTELAAIRREMAQLAEQAEERDRQDKRGERQLKDVARNRDELWADLQATRGQLAEVRAELARLTDDPSADLPGTVRVNPDSAERYVLLFGGGGAHYWRSITSISPTLRGEQVQGWTRGTPVEGTPAAEALLPNCVEPLRCDQQPGCDGKCCQPFAGRAVACFATYDGTVPGCSNCGATICKLYAAGPWTHYDSDGHGGKAARCNSETLEHFRARGETDTPEAPAWAPVDPEAVTREEFLTAPVGTRFQRVDDVSRGPMRSRLLILTEHKYRFEGEFEPTLIRAEIASGLFPMRVASDYGDPEL